MPTARSSNPSPLKSQAASDHPKKIPLLVRVRAAAEELAEGVVGEAGFETLSGDSVAHDDQTRIQHVEAVVVWHAGGQVGGTVAVEVADGERPGETVSFFGNEDQQVFVAEPLGAHGGQPDARRSGGVRLGEHGEK